MQSQPLVSIILTLYEIKSEYLKESLETIFNQTYQNFEIIAINDCSPTIDYEWLNDYSPKIRYYKNEVNLKMNKTVNRGFDLAKGKYVVRLGSDDYFDKTLLEKEVNFLENNPEYGAICCELQRFGMKAEYISRPKIWNLKETLNGKIQGYGYAGGFMFRQELLNKGCKINENYKMCEDYDFHLQILELMPVKSINEVLYFYRSHETNLCKTVKTQERYNINEQIVNIHRKKYNLPAIKLYKKKSKNRYF